MQSVMSKEDIDIKLFEQLRLALDTVNSLIAIKNIDGVYTYVNKAVDEYYKDKFDSIVGKNYKEIYPTSEQATIRALDKETIDLGKTINKTIRIYTDKGFIYVDSSRSPIYDSDGNAIGIISAGRNVTEREETKIKLARTIEELEAMNNKNYMLAYLDELTKIGNRRKFYKDFLALEGKSQHLLIIIDLNNFKKINDTLGHTKGDQVLIEFAQLLKGVACQYGGSVYRLGGDEFTLLLPASAPSFDTFIGKLDEALQAFHKDVTVSFGEVSIGIDQTIDQIYRDLSINRADDILYKYKKSKKQDSL